LEINIVVFGLCGFPAWAIALNGVIRNWYGHLLHANLPWTYGPVAGRGIVSSVLHRWHHTRDKAQSGRNFSTVFALWDVLFCSWYCPHRDVGALGIGDPGFPSSWAGQMIWPFRIWARALRHTHRRRPVSISSR
jgi:sterol desaturase/sphingolipid hydroxylase (fatty acid hydroxylase superfamily)